MTAPKLNLTPISFKSLNSRQKENYNFQKVSARFADYGFVTIRLSDDWNGADFIARHISGEQFLKVQLKGRLVVDTKYKGKDIWICFRHKEAWYLYPHDAFLRWALKHTDIGKAKGWKYIEDWNHIVGAYHWSAPPKEILLWLKSYVLTPIP